MGSMLFIYGVLVLIDFWRRVVECWPLSSSDKKVCQGTSRWSTWQEWSYLCKASAEVRSLAGVMLFTPQPVLQLSDTTRVYFFTESTVACFGLVRLVLHVRECSAF